MGPFDQHEFVPEGWTFEQSTLKDQGLIYVPHECEGEQAAQCNVHFAFHGCGGNADSVALHWGYNEFASTNKLIMVYPDSVCWGYNGSLEDDKMFTHEGMMPKTITAMMERVTSGVPSSYVFLQ